jgi:hypothetical protein
MAGQVHVGMILISYRTISFIPDEPGQAITLGLFLRESS